MPVKLQTVPVLYSFSLQLIHRHAFLTISCASKKAPIPGNVVLAHIKPNKIMAQDLSPRFHESFAGQENTHATLRCKIARKRTKQGFENNPQVKPSPKANDPYNCVWLWLQSFQVGLSKRAPVGPCCYHPRTTLQTLNQGGNTTMNITKHQCLGLRV